MWGAIDYCRVREGMRILSKARSLRRMAMGKSVGGVTHMLDIIRDSAKGMRYLDINPLHWVAQHREVVPKSIGWRQNLGAKK